MSQGAHRYLALLRAVNLSGGRQVKMPALRKLLEGLGMTDVVTYLQSGNVVFATQRLDRAATIRILEDAIGAEFGFEIPVILRDRAQMGEVVASNPYETEAAADPTRVHVTFVEPPPSAGSLSGFDPDRYHPEVHTLGDGVIYMNLPQGIGRAKLPAALARLLSGTVATTRNWRTVVSLTEMLES